MVNNRISRLFRRPPLDAKTLEVIERIEALKERLRWDVSRPRRWRSSLRRFVAASALRGSNTIEGYNVTVEDAIAAQENQEPLDAGAEAWQAVRGYAQAMTYVLQLAEDPHFTFSTDLLRSLHFMMLQHDLSKNPGRWRPGGIFIKRQETGEIVYEGPDVDLVPSLMAELIATLQQPSDGHYMVDAAMAHLNLVLIHPFSDGNGRMARCLQTLVLARTGTLAPEFSSIEEHLGRNTPAYYAALQETSGGRWQPDRDASAWTRFCLRAHYQQARRLLRRNEDFGRFWEEMETFTSAAGLPERTLNALSDAAQGLKVRNATYRTIAEVSDQVASRDLKALVETGFLTSHGAKRGRFYTASDRLLLIRHQTRQQPIDDDPFA